MLALRGVRAVARRPCRLQPATVVRGASPRLTGASRRRRQQDARCHSTAFATSSPAPAGSAVGCRPDEGFAVAVEVGPSPLGGVGLFAAEPIPKDALVWTFSAANCLTFATEQEVRGHLARLTPDEVADFLGHAYVGIDPADGRTPIVVDIMDNGRFWNHSGAAPNVASPDHDVVNTYAVRDIAAGEELLDDYGEYGVLDWYERLCKEFGAESLAVFARSGVVEE